MQTVVFTLNVNRFHREVAEKACEVSYTSKAVLRYCLEKQAKGSEEEDGHIEINIYDNLLDFCEECNNEEIELLHVWVGYAEVGDG